MRLDPRLQCDPLPQHCPKGLQFRQTAKPLGRPWSVDCTTVPPHELGSGLHREEGRRLFGLDPAGYRAGRPDYPEVVYETLVERCGLGPRTRALEIGPGTGLVTQHLLREGAHVTAVEPDPAMATYLQDTAASANLDVVITS